MFDRYERFVNTARYNPAGLTLDKTSNKLVLKDSDEHPIQIMCGGVVSSSIHEDMFVYTNGKAVNGVCLSVFPQEFRRDSSAWGEKLNFRTIEGSINKTDGTLMFLTRPQGWGSNRDGKFYLIY